MDKIVKSYRSFINEGKREQQKIDELLEIMNKRKLTAEEHELLVTLSKGGSLPDEPDDRPILQTHKTGGGYLFDDEGNVLTDEEPEKPGQEFVTVKGKQKGADKLSTKDIMDARVYRNKDNEERRIYVYTTIETDSGITNDWIIYRTGGGDKYPFGQFLDTNAQKYAFYKKMSPEQLWGELDFTFDYGMVLDEDLYEDFINFVELYKENQRRNIDVLNKLRLRFLKLL